MKYVCSVSWEVVFGIGHNKRYNLYDAKNKLFLVSAVLGRYKKITTLYRLLVSTDTKNCFSKFKKMTEPRPRPVEPRSRPCSLPPQRGRTRTTARWKPSASSHHHALGTAARLAIAVP
jgi:hypothetical protein